MPRHPNTLHRDITAELPYINNEVLQRLIKDQTDRSGASASVTSSVGITSAISTDTEITFDKIPMDVIRLVLKELIHSKEATTMKAEDPVKWAQSAKEWARLATISRNFLIAMMTLTETVISDASASASSVYDRYPILEELLFARIPALFSDNNAYHALIARGAAELKKQKGGASSNGNNAQSDKAADSDSKIEDNASLADDTKSDEATDSDNELDARTVQQYLLFAKKGDLEQGANFLHREQELSRQRDNFSKKLIIDSSTSKKCLRSGQLCCCAFLVGLTGVIIFMVHLITTPSDLITNIAFFLTGLALMFCILGVGIFAHHINAIRLKQHQKTDPLPDLFKTQRITGDDESIASHSDDSTQTANDASANDDSDKDDNDKAALRTGAGETTSLLRN